PRCPTRWTMPETASWPPSPRRWTPPPDRRPLEPPNMASNPGFPVKIVLRDLPLAARLTLSLFLIAVGLGYFSALVQLHFQHATRGQPLPTPNDVVEVFSGVEGWPYPKPPPPRPVSKIEQLIMAPENLPHNGSGTMAFAFFGTERKPVPPD